MSLPVVFRPEAQAEFEEAAAWYERRRVGLGADFIARVNEVVDRIRSMPEAYAAVYGNVRRGIVHRFPYSVLYRIESQYVLVVAVFHASRDPSVWQVRAD